MKSPITLVVTLAAALLLAACASRTRAPVEDRTALPPPPVVAATPAAATPEKAAAPEPDWRPPSYTVKRGDTLYQIALDHGLDYRELAVLNNIENVNLIRVGQVLRLSAATDPATGVTTAPLKTAPAVEARTAGAAATTTTVAAVPRSGDNLKVAPKAIKEPYSPEALREVTRAASAPEVVAAAPVAVVPRPEASSEATRPPPTIAAAPSTTDGDDDRIDWVWPAKGKVVTTFAETANLKGIDIAGSSGAPVLASAAGTVVYAGTGLRGYGKLIIIKHNKTFLSAYAHNREILVKEGQQVTRGQRIAEMGNTDADQVKLHFEVRRLGKPMDPLRYLPPA